MCCSAPRSAPNGQRWKGSSAKLAATNPEVEGRLREHPRFALGLSAEHGGAVFWDREVEESVDGRANRPRSVTAWGEMPAFRSLKGLEIHPGRRLQASSPGQSC